MNSGDATSDWGVAWRLLFRIAFVYLILYATQMLPLWWSIVPWVGQQVFDIDATFRFRGSGDTTFNYVQIFCFFALGGAVSAIWTALDRKRINYVRLHEWLRVVVRFFLATAMFAYGGGKVIPDQFPSPSLDRLSAPLGDAPPMALLWAFMGASEGYSVFTGAAEMLGGLLLCFRRTTLLGAIICCGVLSNVVALNFCYDVPVKLLASHLFLMAVFLSAPDLRRLANMFLFNRPVEPVACRPFFAKCWLNRAALMLRAAFVVLVPVLSLYVSYYDRKNFGDGAPEPPLYGIWDVGEFEADGKVRPPLITDAARWRRVIFPRTGPLAIQLMDDSRRQYSLEVDAGAKTVALTRDRLPNWKAALSYREPEPGLLELEGTFDGRRVRVKLRRADESQFPLVSRGFRWVID